MQRGATAGYGRGRRGEGHPAGWKPTARPKEESSDADPVRYYGWRRPTPGAWSVPFAAASSELGHDVVVAAPGSAQPAVRRVGLPFHAVGESTGAERGADVRAHARGIVRRTQHHHAPLTGLAGIFAGAALPTMSDLIEHWRPDVVVRESLEFASAGRLAAAPAQGVPHVQVATNLLVTLDDADGSMKSFGQRVTELLATAGVARRLDRAAASDERLLSLVPPSLERPDDRDRAARYRARDVDRSVAANVHRPLVFLTFGTEAAGQFYPGALPRGDPPTRSPTARGTSS